MCNYPNANKTCLISDAGAEGREVQTDFDCVGAESGHCCGLPNCPNCIHQLHRDIDTEAAR